MIASKDITARASHRCSACLARVIKPGDVYKRETYVQDGTIYVWNVCQPCEAITLTVMDWVVDHHEGITADDYREWALETEHGAAVAYLARAASGEKS